MSQTVAAGNVYTSRLALGAAQTGQTGNVRFRLLDNDQNPDDPVYGPSNASIVEDPSGSGSYVFTGTAPDVYGNYARAWDTGPGSDLVYDEDLIVVSDALAAFVPSGHEYVTLEELKTILGLQRESFNDYAIAIAVEAASRAIDGYTRTRFYAVTETRVYSPDRSGYALALNDLSSLTSVEVDTDGDGVYETTWVNGTDFTLDPTNVTLDQRPYRTLTLRRQGNQLFPRYSNGLRVTGSFGWATTPTLVKQATVLLANRLLTRAKSAPLGVLIATGTDSVAAAQVGRIDKDVEFLLAQIPGLVQLSGLTSIQLG